MTLLKRILIGALVVLALLGAAVGYVFHTAFGHNRPIVDRRVIEPGVEMVKDGIVSIAVLDGGPNQVALIDAGYDKAGKAILSALAASEAKKLAFPHTGPLEGFEPLVTFAQNH